MNAAGATLEAPRAVRALARGSLFWPAVAALAVATPAEAEPRR